VPFAFDATPSGAASNSWATAAEANDYFAGRRYADAWTALSANGTPSAREIALADGTHDLEQLEYDGSLAVSTQRLRIPRSGLSDGDGRPLSTATVPRVFKEALFEHVLFKLNQGRDTQQPTGLEGFESIEVPGAVALTLRAGAAAPRYAGKSLQLLARYLVQQPGVTRLVRSA
jgi:hypothetical protein